MSAKKFIWPLSVMSGASGECLSFFMVAKFTDNHEIIRQAYNQSCVRGKSLGTDIQLCGFMYSIYAQICCIWTNLFYANS